MRSTRLLSATRVILFSVAVCLSARDAGAQPSPTNEDPTPRSEAAEEAEEAEGVRESGDEKERFDAPPPAVETLPPPAGAAVDEIVVTATKREQRLQDVAISMAALTGAALEDSGISDFDVLSEYVPNLQINAVTDTRQTAIRVCGIGQTGFNAGIEPSVGVLTDDFFQGRTGMIAALDPLDIDRVEVLRGLQGTLFGKNTAAGAIRIITKRPTF